MRFTGAINSKKGFNSLEFGGLKPFSHIQNIASEQIFHE